jgi:hypothetical protein
MSSIRWVVPRLFAAMFVIVGAVIVAGPVPPVAAAPPANDLIEDATPITSVPFSATQDSTDATVSPTDPGPSCNHGSAAYSVWYSYTPAADGAIKVATSSASPFSTPLATIYQGALGALTEVGCRNAIVAVTAGASYYIRLSVPGCCPGVFTINVTAPSPPANDLIEDATPIAIPFSATQDSTDAMVSPSDPPSTCDPAPSSTIWYSFTAPADGRIRISNLSTATLYRGDPGSLVQVGCGGATMPVTPGETYFVMVSFGSGCCAGPFTLDITIPPLPPANDLIENAARIPSIPFTAAQNSAEATMSPTDPSSCGGFASYTLWYAYTPTEYGRVRVATSESDIFATPQVSVFRGSPGSLTPAGCGNTVDVAAGVTYYFMLSVPGCCFGRFTLDLTVPPPPPVNDVVEGAVEVTSLPFTANDDSTEATTSPSDPPPACGTFSTAYSLWYSYTATDDGYIRGSTSSTTFFVAPAVRVYQGAPGALSLVGCGPVVPVTAGTTYYVMLSVSGCCRGSFTFDLRTATPPANDLREEAVPIGPLPFSAAQPTLDATHSPSDPPSACIGGDVPTVWYSLNAPGDGLIRSTVSGFFSTYVSIYRDDSGTLQQVGCSFGGSPLVTRVTAGAGYFLAVTDLRGEPVTLSVASLLTASFPDDVEVEATGPGGAAVDFTATASLPDGTPMPVDCSPPAGSTFHLGDTTVGCVASDGAGHNLDGSFVVRVVDTTAPSIEVPSSMDLDATAPGGAAATYTPTAHDTVDLAPSVTCDPPSGTTFPIGDAVVTCSAVDASGNAADPATFKVHVRGAPEQLVILRAAVAALSVPSGTRTGLLEKLDDATRALARGNSAAACGALADFVAQVTAQAGKKVPTTIATALVTDVGRIRAVIGCRPGR